MSDSPQDDVDNMARSRGYVLDYHTVMAKHDVPVLQAANGLVNARYLDQRSLDRRTKELIFIVRLTVMRASKGHVQSHIRTALDLGVSAQEILEAIEISLPEAGIVAFRTGRDGCPRGRRRRRPRADRRGAPGRQRRRLLTGCPGNEES